MSQRGGCAEFDQSEIGGRLYAIGIGTERHLVERLAEEYRGRKTILTLWPSGCANMARTNPVKLLDLLSTWPVRNRISVADDIVPDARLALDRMMRL